MVGLNRSINIGRIIEEIRFEKQCQASSDMTKFLSKKCKRNNVKRRKHK